MDDIKKINFYLLEYGIIGYCPTIISSPLEVYQHNLPLIAEATQLKEGAQILGVHLEGPFINPEEGFRGAHSKQFTILPSIELFEQFRSFSQDKIALLTLAPELKGALNLIKYIIDTCNVVVSIGHSSANKEIIQKAVDLGVQAATHVGNGLPNMIHRHNNPLWTILAEDRLIGFFITDGYHLPKEMIKACLRVKGASKFIVTSDLVHLAGNTPGNCFFHDIPVVLEPNDYLHTIVGDHLTGSTSTMMECMNTLASLNEVDEQELYKIGFENPLKLLNRKINVVHLTQAPKIIYKNQKFMIKK